jgi:small multidrug resistance pump
MGYVYLTFAIIAEVVGTSALKASEEFTKPGPTFLVVAGYGIAFYMLTFVLRTIPVGIAYAMWSGLGIALISVIGVVLFQQSLDWPAIAGIVLIISGVAVIHLFSKAIAH